MAKKRICLDPGHYGSKYNKGAVDGYYESAIVWKLTMMEKEILENIGIEVVLTRHNINENPGLKDRGKMAAGCDLFVSNHTNACGTPSVTRAVTLYMTNRNDTNIDNISKDFASKLAQTIDKTMGGIGHQTYSKLSEYDLDGNGAKDDNYYGVLNGAFIAGVPGVIAEHSFHTNANSCKWLMNDNNLRKLAEACARCMAIQVGVTEATDKDIDAVDFKEFTREEILAKIGGLLTEEQSESGILASVIGAQLILESDGLQSELAQNANNCFGMKENLSGNKWAGSTWDGSIYTKKTSEWDGSKYIEIVANFRKYPDIIASIADHSAYLLGAMKGDKKRYEGLAGCKDHEKALQIIKDGGYATSPTYVENLLAVIDRYDLKKYDLKENVVEETTKVPFKVKVLINDLNYRSAPSMSGKVKGQTGKGTFTIVEEENNWGKLKSGLGWIWLGNSEYCEIQANNVETKVETETKVESKPTSKTPFTVNVEIDNLNIRTGAGIEYARTGHVTGKGIFTITEVKEGKGSEAGWGKLKSGAGWISLDYTKRV